MRRSLALLAVALALAACGGGTSDGSTVCTPLAQKSAVRDLMRGWYLYEDLLPEIAPSDPAYPDLPSYLDALARPAQEQGLDKGWTFATTVTENRAVFEEGTSVGFGFGSVVRGSQLFVTQVFDDPRNRSAAARAGFLRGDEILAIGETPDRLVDVPTLLSTNALGSAIGPPTAGIARSFRVRPVAGGADVVRPMTKGTFGLDSVPTVGVIHQDGLPPEGVGYVSLRTFIGPADPLLRDAFGQLRLAGVNDVIVDLRYNGGGLVTTAEVLANLLAGGLTGQTMYRAEFNALRSSQNGTVAFEPEAQSVAPRRIAFITTGASASASELVPNALEAWKGTEVALVGARTFGKPVGQLGFALEGCDVAVFLVAFRLLNAQGDGSYFEGLPDEQGRFSGPLCDAPDDVAHPQGDPAEASTAAALSWIANGACPAQPAPAAPGAAALKAAAAPDRYPEPAQPDLAQRHVRGLF